MLKELFLWSASVMLGLAADATAFGAEVNVGREMYVQYFGSGHGRDGKGMGTVSRELKTKTPDLTIIAKKNHGIYPLDDVMATIDGRRIVRGHGMPNPMRTIATADLRNAAHSRR